MVYKGRLGGDVGKSKGTSNLNGTNHCLTSGASNFINSVFWTRVLNSKKSVRTGKIWKVCPSFWKHLTSKYNAYTVCTFPYTIDGAYLQWISTSLGHSTPKRDTGQTIETPKRPVAPQPVTMKLWYGAGVTLRVSPLAACGGGSRPRWAPHSIELSKRPEQSRRGKIDDIDCSGGLVPSLFAFPPLYSFI